MASTTLNNTLNARVGDLYRDHSPWLLGWLRGRLGGNNADAADLVQDTYVRLIDSGRYPPPGQGRAFLARIAGGLVIDLHRRRRLESAYLEALAARPEPVAPSEEERALVLDLLVRMDRVLDRLPARASQAFLLSRFEGLTYAAVAERLGVSQAAVRKYMLKATQACLLALDDEAP
ncbi:sigma-70 family RNA polymerase sigma factor [Alloalcanivorax gelatiniphagus]|uniref:Sigma-70 family RNA polymerase sigma factor n=1 Tax=Alloalcanivorax gelatiniphagus TaxID=1194167 RepID=A0ABY2XLU6_9GAMM|nr:sigma-70 family RNA polymerase sigma factor [Alloalcanivorax gelatiniphagus]TMW13173.1 sigma-70 family RNA polymerase sigma factor [Alloalcanivorax gelatiniphagus]|tara:strand:- start:4864 stop:5391 length:528 start_codon:yes stop_codon:yes gene_type:complete